MKIKKYKHIIVTIIVIISLFMLCSCGNEQKVEKNEEEINTFLDGKYFCYCPTVGLYTYMKFSDGDFVQIVHEDTFTKNKSQKYEKYYGIYKIDGHKLTISVPGYDDTYYVFSKEKNGIYIKDRVVEIENTIDDEYVINLFE